MKLTFAVVLFAFAFIALGRATAPVATVPPPKPEKVYLCISKGGVISAPEVFD